LKRSGANDSCEYCFYYFWYYCPVSKVETDKLLLKHCWSGKNPVSTPEVLGRNDPDVSISSRALENSELLAYQ
jgi:hypothetical protein